MTFIKRQLFLVVVLLFCACSKPDYLEYALQQAGENRVELEKVLNFYRQNPADSLKYKAACFLIENMPYYTYWEGEQCSNYLTYYKYLKENQGKGISAAILSDSIQMKYGPYEQPFYLGRHPFALH